MVQAICTVLKTVSRNSCIFRGDNIDTLDRRLEIILTEDFDPLLFMCRN